MRHLVTVLLALISALGTSGCSESSPTEPTAKTGALSVSLDVVPSTVGLTVSSPSCECSASPVTVTVNGNILGSLPCSSQQAFAAARIVPSAVDSLSVTYDVTVVVSDHNGMTGLKRTSLVFAKSEGGPPVDGFLDVTGSVHAICAP